MDEINANLTEEITPRLDDLRGQKTHYLKWKANDGEENRLQKFCVAYSFTQAETTLNSSEEEKKELEDEKEALQAAQKEAEVSACYYYNSCCACCACGLWVLCGRHQTQVMRSREVSVRGRQRCDGIFGQEYVCRPGSILEW